MSNFSEATFKFSPYNTYEHLSYDGISSELEIRQRFRIRYKCTYRMTNYPFDEQTCQFKMKIKALNGRNVTFVEDYPGVQYVGDNLIKQFKIIDVRSFIKDLKEPSFNGSVSLFIFELTMDRNYYDQIQMIFIPTFLLWFVAYMTLYVSIDDFGNRCKIAVSILLILVSLLGATTQDFPKTTYFKFIDLWFFWYILSIFLIILHHILLENIDKARHDWTTFSANHLRGPKDNGNNTTNCCRSKYLTKNNINRIAKFVFLVANMIFMMFYLCLSFVTTHNRGHDSNQK